MRQTKDRTMRLGHKLLLAINMMMLATIPVWSHSAGWGFGLSGGLGAVLLIVALFTLTGWM